MVCREACIANVLTVALVVPALLARSLTVAGAWWSYRLMHPKHMKQNASRERENDGNNKNHDPEQSRALDTTQIEACFAAKLTIQVIMFRLFELLPRVHFDSNHNAPHT
jgi:hypothetical protein